MAGGYGGGGMRGGATVVADGRFSGLQGGGGGGGPAPGLVPPAPALQLRSAIGPPTPEKPPMEDRRMARYGRASGGRSTEANSKQWGEGDGKPTLGQTLTDLAGAKPESLTAKEDALPRVRFGDTAFTFSTDAKARGYYDDSAGREEAKRGQPPAAARGLAQLDAVDPNTGLPIASAGAAVASISPVTGLPAAGEVLNGAVRLNESLGQTTSDPAPALGDAPMLGKLFRSAKGDEVARVPMAGDGDARFRADGVDLFSQNDNAEKKVSEFGTWFNRSEPAQEKHFAGDFSIVLPSGAQTGEGRVPRDQGELSDRDALAKQTVTVTDWDTSGGLVLRQEARGKTEVLRRELESRERLAEINKAGVALAQTKVAESEAKVPLDLKLPAPAFKGTPKDLQPRYKEAGKKAEAAQENMVYSLNTVGYDKLEAKPTDANAPANTTAAGLVTNRGTDARKETVAVVQDLERGRGPAQKVQTPTPRQPSLPLLRPFHSRRCRLLRTISPPSR